MSRSSACKDARVSLLDGRVVLVTGAGRGLGRAHALALARAGATVVVNDLGVSLAGAAGGDASPAERVVEEIDAVGGRATADATSVTDWEGIEALISRIVEQYGRLDAVVNNAGILRDRILTSMSEDDFDSVMSVHVKGTFVVTRHACAHWRSLAKAGERVTDPAEAVLMGKNRSDMTADETADDLNDETRERPGHLSRSHGMVMAGLVPAIPM